MYFLFSNRWQNVSQHALASEEKCVTIFEISTLNTHTHTHTADLCSEHSKAALPRRQLTTNTHPDSCSSCNNCLYTSDHEHWIHPGYNPLCRQLWPINNVQLM